MGAGVCGTFPRVLQDFIFRLFIGEAEFCGTFNGLGQEAETTISFCSKANSDGNICYANSSVYGYKIPKQKFFIFKEENEHIPSGMRYGISFWCMFLLLQGINKLPS